jgi:hypothetical protein
LAVSSSVDLCAEGKGTMGSLPREVEPGVESPLVDLGAIPLSVLRRLDDTALRRSLGHVVEQVSFVRVSSDHGAERID